MNPKVSIIIPSFNSKSTIRKCLDSCISQTFSEIEILVVNDGSSDGSVSIIQEYQKKDHRVRLIDKKNEGSNYARKTGLEASKGICIFYLDADDTIPSETIETLYGAYIVSDADIVAGDVKIYRGDTFSKKRLYSNFGEGNGSSFLDFILENKLHYVWGKLIRRDLYIKNDIQRRKDIVIGEDQIEIYQLCMFVNKVVSADVVSYNYILNDTSVTQRKTKDKKATTNLEVYAHALFGLLRRFSFNTYARQQINLRILWALFGAIGISKKFEHSKSRSTKILYHTILDSVFSSKSLVWKHGGLILKSITYPIVFGFLNLKKK